MGQLARKFALNNIEGFRNKLVGRQKMISKSMRFSRKVVGEGSPPNSHEQKSHNNTSLFYNEVLNMSSHDVRGSYRPQQSVVPEGVRGSQARNGRGVQLAAVLQRHYANRFAEEWVKRAKSGSSQQRNTFDNLLGEGRGSIKPTSSHIENRSVLRTSRKQ